MDGNFGDEEQTIIHKLQLYGCPGNKTDMGDWEKVAKKGQLHTSCSPPEIFCDEYEATKFSIS